MGGLKRPWIWIWVFLALFLYLLRFFPQWVERYYSQGIYPYITKVFRWIVGWIPFSVGDLLYLGLILLLFYWLGRGIYRLIKKGFHFRSFFSACMAPLCFLLGMYVIFQLSWGLNYQRLGIPYTLQLQVPAQYSTGSLQALTRSLLEQTNESRKQLPDTLSSVPAKEIFSQSLKAYAKTAVHYPFLQYEVPSIKEPLWNTLGNYLGYGGYFNPFTHEAQVGTQVPVFLLPFTSCHEMAHQLGYASEDEANFIAYLTASHLEDPLFEYAANFALYRYANRELWYRDSTLAKRNNAALDTLVKQDYADMIRFFAGYESRLEDLSTFLYHQYLIANNQVQGIDTYAQVTALLLAYRKNNSRRQL